MSDWIGTILQDWRENYLLSNSLVAIARPIWFISRRLAMQIETKVKKNGVTIRLANGKNLAIARDAGVGVASLLFWHGLDGYERDTSIALQFFFSFPPCSLTSEQIAGCTP